MSDNIKYNKELADQGWEQMSAILDKEMPIEKKRRYPFFLLFCFVLLSGIIGVWYFTDQYEAIYKNEIVGESKSDADISELEKSKIDLKSDGVINEQEINTLNDNIKAINSLEAISLKEESDNKNETEFSNINLTNRIKSSFNTNYNVNTFKNSNLSSRLIPRYYSLDKTIVERIEGKEVFKNKVIHEEGNSNPELKILNKKNYQDLIAFTELKEINTPLIEVLKEFEFTVNQQGENNDNKFRNKKWRFGLESGFVFHNRNEKGFRARFLVTRKLNKTLSLSTGLEYNLQSVRYSEREVEENVSDLDNNMIGDFQGESNELSANIDVRNHYFKIPLSLGVRLNKSFELNTGIIGSYKFFFQDNSNNPMDEVTIIALPSNSEFEGINPTFDIAGSIGIMYYPIHRLGLGIRYDHGFMNRKINYNINGEKAAVDLLNYNKKARELSVGLRYYFN